MSEMLLTKLSDFRSDFVPPPVWPDYMSSDVQALNPRRGLLTAATMGLLAACNAQPCVSPLSASEHMISNSEVKGKSHDSPVDFTRKPADLKIKEFISAFYEAKKLSEMMVVEGEGAALNIQTWIYAAQELISLVATLDLPSPLMLPLQNGGIGAEWHDLGLNIELRFRNPYQIYAVLEDARGIIPELHDYDPNLVQARISLRELATRKRS